MSRNREYREYKEVSTRKYKQEIENLKLDIIELQDILQDCMDSINEKDKLKIQNIISKRCKFGMFKNK